MQPWLPWPCWAVQFSLLAGSASHCSAIEGRYLDSHAPDVRKRASPVSQGAEIMIAADQHRPRLVAWTQSTRRTSQPAALFTRDRRRTREQEKRLRYSKPETQQGMSRTLLLRQGSQSAAWMIPNELWNKLHWAVSVPGTVENKHRFVSGLLRRAEEMTSWAISGPSSTHRLDGPEPRALFTRSASRRSACCRRS